MNTHHKNLNRIWGLAAAFILAALLALAPACSRSRATTAPDSPETATPAGVVPVVRKNLTNYFEIASEFIPYQQIDIHAKVSGYVQKLLVNWGTHVRTGQLMAVLEVPELQATVLRDQAAIERDKERLSRARQELDRAVSAYTVAHLTYERLYGVQKTNPQLVAQEEVDIDQGKDLEAGSNVVAARDALAAAQQQLSVDKSILGRDQYMFGYSRITAPFDGVVTRLDAYTGSLLPAGTSASETGLPLCRLSQTDLLRLVIPVPEAIVPEVRVGESVNVRVVPLDRTFSGKVSLVSGQIDLATRTMHTEVEVPNSKYLLVPGMYAYVDLPVKRAENALSLPIQAVQNAQPEEGIVLMVNRSDRVDQRTVRLGVETATDVQIMSGLQAGDRVIFGDLTRYHPGELVKPTPVDLAALTADVSGANE
ncbi:MAG TPA: efflux RND transporter periplasmic adaptor subunit [Terriglobia bacterium]|nr:efflux RND transporter periplasmic adaptor subunit [Terriglobia bacterium]